MARRVDGDDGRAVPLAGGLASPGAQWRTLACSARKKRVIELAHEYLIPGRVEAFLALGVPLVIGRREGYRIWDVDGRELMDFHLNGGTYSVGHRNPAIVRELARALETLDIGNHHFPSEARADLAEKLAANTPGDLHYTVYTSSGSEAVDVAIRSARRFTGRRKIVSISGGYHGRSGLSGAAGDDTAARSFASDYPQEFVKVPFNDLSEMERALLGADVAAVLIETLPATCGFPVPTDDYLPGVAELCRTHGSLYIADEVQTGLGRTGSLWGVGCWDVEPDVLVTGKGLSGGMYPMAAAVLRKDVGGWLTDDGWGFVSTFGGAEPGCVVGSMVLDLCRDEQTLAHVRTISDYLAAGLDEIRSRRGFLVDIRRKGLVMGLVFDRPDGGRRMSSALYENGIWAMFAGFDPSVLQFKPGLFIDEQYCDEALTRFDDAVALAKQCA